MDLQDIQSIFNRSLSLTFIRKKISLVFFVLLACGLLGIFFRGLSLNTGTWLTLSLTFMPIFLCAGVLVATGIILIRIYHNEIKEKNIRYRDVLRRSLDVIIGSAYLSIPIILGYLLLWMLLGVFFLLNSIPGIGGFFSVVLAFGPLLLNFGALVMCILSLSLLFFVTPVIALKGNNRIQMTHVLNKRFQKNAFLNLCLATIAAMPFILVFAFLTLAAMMSGTICYTCDDKQFLILQWFIMTIPFAAILAPAVIFFFNFAAESHVLLQRYERI